MHRLRFPLASAVLASAAGVSGCLLAAAPAWAQSAPATTAPPVAQPASGKPVPARIDDIQIARDGEKVSILVKLSAQPGTASATASPSGLVLEIEGVQLAPLSLTPQSGQLVTKVEAQGGRLSLSGAALIGPSTIIYRNAILVESRLADPASIGGVSLIRSPGPKAPAPEPVPSAPPAKPVTPPEPVKQAPSAAMPAPPQAPAPLAATATAAVAGISAARCTAAPGDLAKDTWDLAAMGDTALCLIDDGKIEEARARLDQLAAITPQDWRVPLGRAVLAEREGDVDGATALYAAASRAAPDEAIRSLLSGRLKAPTKNQLSSAADDAQHSEPAPASLPPVSSEIEPAETQPAENQAAKEPDLQLPLPSAPSAQH